MTTTQVMIPDPVQKLFRGHTNWVFSVAISSDKKWIVSGSEDCTIKVWNVKTEECMRTLEGHRNRVYSVVFSPDGKWIVSGSYDKTIKIWNGETGECVRTLKGHGRYVRSVENLECGNRRMCEDS
ncbi:MAG: NWD2 protein [Candidatus Uhrbacteria bacterium GW2011_GWE2_40_58]|nr:MAG: NWD2 protein [Candidatus Uhrbacteria bacterium GW2011_GWE2_40_58]